MKNLLQISEQNSGSLLVQGHLQSPIDKGFVRLNIAAKSKRGCNKAEGYLIKLGGK